MNAATIDRRTTNLQRRLTASLFSTCAAAVLCAGAGIAKAGDAPAPRSVVVKFHDLDLQTEGGAQALYRRIESAAHRVCPDPDQASLDQKAAAWSCRQQALNHAVEAVNSPHVASLAKHPRMASNR
jgi:UrcA family protein